jgi:hypothetical protein
VAQRSGDSDAEPELRAYLLEEAIGFRKLMVSTLLDPDHVDWAETAWEQLSWPVDELANGKPHRFHGYELLDEHPMRAHGIGRDWVLDEHDVLRAVDRVRA